MQTSELAAQASGPDTHPLPQAEGTSSDAQLSVVALSVLTDIAPIFK